MEADAVTGNALVLLAAYLLGSLPTALVVSCVVASVDIRTIGDGNMGARNVTRTLGWGPGVVVGVADFGKGALAVLLARTLDLSPGWQLAAGAAAVVGHDFPLFAGFRGGQGMATILGGLLVLLPVETAWGLATFGGGYLLTRNFDPSAGLGLGLLAFLAWLFDRPGVLLGFTVLLFLSIPVKKAFDRPHRRRLQAMRAADLRSEAALPLREARR